MSPVGYISKYLIPSQRHFTLVTLAASVTNDGNPDAETATAGAAVDDARLEDLEVVVLETTMDGGNQAVEHTAKNMDCASSGKI
jgi:hypothetical protein